MDASATPAETPGEEKKTDLSQFIRTYAKDVAVLTGTKPGTSAVTPAKAASEVEGVVLPEREEPFFSRPQAATQELYNQPLAVPTARELESVIDRSAQTATPTPQKEPTPLAAPEEERESILARLRRKVSERAQMEIETPQMPEPEPVRASEPTPPPTFANTLDTSMPVARMPSPQKPSVPDPGLHTYAGDFAEHIDEKHASTFSVLAAQSDAKSSSSVPTPTRSPFPIRTVITAVLGVVLIVGGAGGAFAAYRYLAAKNSVAPIRPTVPSLVFADEYKELSGSGAALRQALAETANEPLVGENALVTYLTESTTTPKGTLFTRPLPGGYLVEALELPAPEILFRNTEESSTVGVIHAGDETRPFFVLSVSSYERTYAGMLTWEPLMERDLAAFYPLYPRPEAPAAPIATSTASSTAPIRLTPMEPVALTRFTDTTVANHPVRILKDTAGNTLILYGYADKATLIIARNEAAFEALLGRLQAAR